MLKDTEYPNTSINSCFYDALLRTCWPFTVNFETYPASTRQIMNRLRDLATTLRTMIARLYDLTKDRFKTVDPLFTLYIPSDEEFIEQTKPGNTVDIVQMAYFLNCIGFPINYITLQRNINVSFVTIDCPTIIMNSQANHFQAVINQPACILTYEKFIKQLNQIKSEFPVQDNSNLLGELYCLYILSGWHEDPINYALTVHTSLAYAYREPKNYELTVRMTNKDEQVTNNIPVNSDNQSPPEPDVGCQTDVVPEINKEEQAANNALNNDNQSPTEFDGSCQTSTELTNSSAECAIPRDNPTLKKIRPITTCISAETQTTDGLPKRVPQTKVSLLDTLPKEPTNYEFQYQKCIIYAEDPTVFNDHPILKKLFWTEKSAKSDKPTNTKKSTINQEMDNKPEAKVATSNYILRNNIKSTNAHMDLANLRQLYETVNLNSLADDHRLTMRVDNQYYQLYELVDVGSSPRMINRDIECTFLIPTLDSMGDYTRINGRRRAIMQNQQCYKTYVEQTFQEYCMDNDMTISLTSTTGKKIRYNKIFNFTDSIYYINDHDLGQAFMQATTGLVAIGTMHIYKYEGPVQLNKKIMGAVTSDGDLMHMQVDGNSHVYTHPKRFHKLDRNDSLAIDISQNINGVSTVIYTLLVEVKLRTNCVATDYVSFTITKLPPTSLKPMAKNSRQCHRCHITSHTDPSFGQQYAVIPDHTDSENHFCKGTALCEPCLRDYIHKDLKVYTPACLVCNKPRSYIFHGISTPTVIAYNYHVTKAMDTAVTKFGIAHEGKSKEEQQKKKLEAEIDVDSHIMYFRSKHQSQATLIQRISKETLHDMLSDDTSNNFITADGAAVVAVKQAGCIATFMYDDLTITDTTTWASYEHTIRASIFLVDAASLQKTIRTSLSSYNPTNHKDLITLTQLVLSNANELPPKNATAVVVHIMKLHLDMHLELTKVSESLLARTLQDAIDGKFTYKKPSLVRSIFTQFKCNKLKKADVHEHYHKEHTALFFDKKFNYTNYTDEKPYPNFVNHKIIEAGGEETVGFIGTKPKKDDDGGDDDNANTHQKQKKQIQMAMAKGRTRHEREEYDEELAKRKRFETHGLQDMVKEHNQKLALTEKRKARELQAKLTYNPMFDKLLDYDEGEPMNQL